MRGSNTSAIVNLFDGGNGTPEKKFKNLKLAINITHKSQRGPENLKKSKKKTREIAFLAVLIFFPVQKIIFGHF